VDDIHFRLLHGYIRVVMQHLATAVSVLSSTQNEMSLFSETVSAVFDFLLADRAMLKARLATALASDSVDAATIATLRAELKLATDRISELLADESQDQAERDQILDLVQPIVEEIEASQEEEPTDPETPPEPQPPADPDPVTPPDLAAPTPEPVTPTDTEPTNTVTPPEEPISL
jgi:outer membrane biosynthesis protein TonB